MNGAEQSPTRRDTALIFLVALALAALAWLMGFVAALYVAPPSPAVPEGVEAPPNWSLFGEVWGHVDREFYGSEPTGSEVTYRAIEGLVEALDDPYAAYVYGEAARSADLGVSAELVANMGVWVEPVSVGALVMATVPDSAAREAGLAPGDTILAVDREPLAGRKRGELLQLLEGEPGTTAELVVRDMSDVGRAVELQRSRIAVPGVETRELADGTAYVRIPHFSADVARELPAALDPLADRPTQALVVDLRDNPGGPADLVQAVASRLVEGPLWVEVDAAGDESVRMADDATRAMDLPDRVVVLVNAGTAGGAEMLASALREQAGAEIVGERTFGKATIQDVRSLDDGAQIRLTVARWRPISGESVEGEGLLPDREVAGSEAQLEEALAMLTDGRGG